MSELFCHAALKVMRQFLAAPQQGFSGLDLHKATDASFGTIYPMLTRWKDSGWLICHTTTGQKATKRHVYFMTETGREIALDLLRPLQLSTSC